MVLEVISSAYVYFWAVASGGRSIMWVDIDLLLRRILATFCWIIFEPPMCPGAVILARMVLSCPVLLNRQRPWRRWSLCLWVCVYVFVFVSLCLCLCLHVCICPAEQTEALAQVFVSLCLRLCLSLCVFVFVFVLLYRQKLWYKWANVYLSLFRQDN